MVPFRSRVYCNRSGQAGAGNERKGAGDAQRRRALVPSEPFPPGPRPDTRMPGRTDGRSRSSTWQGELLGAAGPWLLLQSRPQGPGREQQQQPPPHRWGNPEAAPLSGYDSNGASRAPHPAPASPARRDSPEPTLPQPIPGADGSKSGGRLRQWPALPSQHVLAAPRLPCPLGASFVNQ